MRHVLLVLVAGGAFFARENFAQETISSMRVLTTRAIEQPSVAASGVVVGSIADRFTRQFGVATPLLAEAKVVQSFSDDCKRVAVTFVKQAVPVPDGPPRDIPVGMEFNVCRNGLPPSAGMDLSTIGRIFRSQGER